MHVVTWKAFYNYKEMRIISDIAEEPPVRESKVTWDWDLGISLTKCVAAPI